jgi:23S rRNA (cytidine1920-2'-O)/16S rRNA (cytidine1409-2'-O)-methyltransferase
LSEHEIALDPLKKSGKIRLDHYLIQNGIVGSRQRAQAVIMAGLVEVNGEKATKPGRRIAPSASVLLKKAPHPYVSRGGLKLEAALTHFELDVGGMILMDVGASTGGFTDCLLQHGAGRIIAVDVGYGQIHWKLRQDPRVEIHERTNIRYLTPGDLKWPIDGAVIDVSFISLRLVVPPVSRLLKAQAFILALIKPQFEVGKGQVGKGGVVRDPAKHRAVIDGLTAFFEDMGWTFQGKIPSPIPGPKGNREFFIYLKRWAEPHPADNPIPLPHGNGL